MYLVVCANCGKQTMVNGPEDNCQFCGKNATKKEVIMVKTNKNVGERGPVPPQAKKEEASPAILRAEQRGNTS